MRLTLGLTGLYERFEGRIFSATEVANGKPAPDLFLHAAATLGADPARCAVVEDSRYGVEAARAAGMRAFGYAGGLTAAERLAGPATTVFHDMRELPALLDGGVRSGARQRRRRRRREGRTDDDRRVVRRRAEQVDNGAAAVGHPPPYLRQLTLRPRPRRSNRPKAARVH